MTVFEFAVTYVVCWWMVLFMVLPHQAMPVVKPAPGHAPSAPANPQIGRKIRWTTLIAIAPAVALYFIVAAAQAETIYHAGNKCAPVNATMAADVNAQDGYSTGGKRVAPATIDSSSPLSSQDHYKLPLLIPAKTFGNTSPGSNGTTNVDLSAKLHRPRRFGYRTRWQRDVEWPVAHEPTRA